MLHRRDARGRLVISGRLARTGWQTYADGDEFRPPEEVFREDSLSSYVGAPVLIGHREVTRDNVESLAVGFVRSIRRDGAHVLGEIVLFREDAIRGVESGQLAEFSMGYHVDVIDVSGRKTQTNIKINHAAMLGRGQARCGATCEVVR